MLFNPCWQESKPASGESWVVELPEDPAEPMEIILDIIHGRFERIPKALSLQDLCDLLALTNKYDMTGVLRPWCAQWIKAARKPDLDTDNTLRSLFIAWELGDEHLFALRLEEISLHAKIDEEGRLSYAALIPSERDAILQDEDYLGPQDAIGRPFQQSNRYVAN